MDKKDGGGVRFRALPAEKSEGRFSMKRKVYKVLGTAAAAAAVWFCTAGRRRLRRHKGGTGGCV